jgi:hypothetical protein
VAIEFYLMILIAILLFFWRKTKVLFNPVSMYALGFSLSLAGILIINSYLSDIDWFTRYSSEGVGEVAFLYFISCLFFCFPFLAKKIKIPQSGLLNALSNDSDNVVIFTDFVAMLLLVNCIVIMVVLGYVPILDMLTRGLTIDVHLENLKQLPIGFMAIQTALEIVLGLHIASVICNRKIYDVGLSHLTFLLLVYMVAAFWQGNRQFILFLLFAIMLRFFLAAEPINLLSLLRRIPAVALAISLFIVVFSEIQELRLQGEGASVFEIGGYLTWPILNLKNIVEVFSLQEISFIPNYIFTEIVPNRLRGEDFENLVKPVLFEPSSPSGFISYWYLDYRVYGVALGSFLFGILACHAFVNLRKSEHSIRIYLLVSYAVITSSVYSHVISTNNFILPFIVLLAQSVLVKNLKLFTKSGARS